MAVLLLAAPLAGCRALQEPSAAPSAIGTAPLPKQKTDAQHPTTASGSPAPAMSPVVRPVDYHAPVALSPPTGQSFLRGAPPASSAVAGSADPVAVAAEDVLGSAANGGEPIPAPPEMVTPAVPGTSLPGTRRPAEYFVGLALSGHPSIRAARQRVAAEANRIPQVSALPDPMFNNTFWPLHDQALQTAAGRIGHQMSLSQAVPWPEKLHARAAIVSREVQIAQAEVERLEREVTESVRLAYYELWYATRALAIVEETQTLVDDLIQVAEARYRSGGSQQDVLRAQLELDRLEEQEVTLRREKEAAQADLAALVQQPVTLLPQAEEELALTEVTQQLDELIQAAEQCNPELRGLAWEVQRDRQNQRLACLQKYPDLQFGINWALVSDDSSVISPVANGHDNLSFTIGTSLPIYREKINAGVREAAHRTRNSMERLEAERDELYGTLRRLLAQADSLVEQREIYSERIIPRTEATLELTVADYRGERTDFFSLVETYRELLMFEMQLARINATLAGRLAQIERAVGCPTN